MKSRHNGMDHHQVNAMLLGQQTGSHVYTPAFEMMPTPKLSGIASVAIIFGASVLGWAAVIGFVAMLRWAL